MWTPLLTCYITHRKRLNIQGTFAHHSWQSHWMLLWPIKRCVSTVICNWICIMTMHFTCLQSCKATMCHKVLPIFLYLLHVNSFILLPVYSLETVFGEVPICQITFLLEIISIRLIRSFEHSQWSGMLNETFWHVWECRHRGEEWERGLDHHHSHWTA